MRRWEWPIGLLILVGIFVALSALRAQAQAPAAGALTIQQGFEDLGYLRVLNRLNLTNEQLTKLVEAIGAYQLQREQAEATRSQPAPQALIDVRARLLRGESAPSQNDADVLGEEAGQQLGLAEQALYQARQNAATQLKAVITPEQVRAFARGEGPLRRVDDLMAELGVSRALPDDQWVQWQQRVVPQMVELVVARDPKAAKAPFEVVSKFLEEARAMTDADFTAQKAALTTKLEQMVLPAGAEADMGPEAADRVTWFLLERSRSALLLREALAARTGG